MIDRPVLTIVVPCYNEEQVVPETARRLTALLDRLIEASRIAAGSSICFVDDGSTDRTWALICDLRDAGRVGGIRLTRNRGHQNALVAGLMTAPGDCLISIDADLQDDIEAIAPMLAAAAAGAEIVFGVRRARHTDTIAKRLTAHLYYHLLRVMGVEIVFDHADFRLMTRRAIDALAQYSETNLFLRALIPQLGFTTQIVTYERSERFAGVTKYSFRKMLALAVEGVTSFSTRPLQIVTIIGGCTALISIGLTIWAFLAAVVFRHVIPGWASTVIPIYLVCSVQLLSLGVIGEYVGKIYLETKHRPRFLIAESLTPHDGAVRTSATLMQDAHE
jgi:glycosyltransferase involved in cell wall biosynthesis